MNKKSLVITHGYFGDIIFSTTLAERLKLELGYDVVDYLIGFPQMVELIEENPYIDNIFYTTVGPSPQFDHSSLSQVYDLFPLGPMQFKVPPPQQMQSDCGFSEPYITSFKTYVDSDPVEHYRNEFKKKSNDKPIVCWGNDLYDRAFEFTEEEYARAIDVPYKGYGGRLRDIDFIIEKLSHDFHMIEVGVRNKRQNNLEMSGSQVTLYEMSAMMKAADLYFGIEGGLVNFASAVGTPTVILGEYHHQLYGPKGVIKQIKEPKLGPRYYFDTGIHKELPLYKTTEEIVVLAKNALFDLHNGRGVQ
jgi:hypothetical protein